MAENTRDGWPAPVPSDKAGGREPAPVRAHPLDSQEMQSLHSKLMGWYYNERDLQADNRSEMEIDAGFYDGEQWDPEDVAVLRDRGQMPLVYNEVAPMVDWMIGTERRTRLDYKVLPRTEDDVQGADAKTKVVKYVSDVNGLPFVKSQAFSDSMKAGLGWVDVGIRDDPTQEAVYVEYEDWRRVLYDSKGSQKLTLDDGRYVFRWRLMDEDVAAMMFPGRRDAIYRAASMYESMWDWDDEEPQGWGAAFDSFSGGRVLAGGRSSTAGADGTYRRRMVKVIECQYRTPVATKIIAAGAFAGAPVMDNDAILAAALEEDPGLSIIDKVMMRVHTAIFTESDMLAWGINPYRHNRFTLTPIWCYRRTRDRLPYGMVRRVRSVQQDLNKRASKALFLLNSNQVVMDEGAVDDIDVLREEVASPDGVIIKKANKGLQIRRDSEMANGQVEIMALDAQSIQKSAGVAQENLGRQTNAVSGEAIKARQTQGSVVTTEPFDNLRLASQSIGQKVLSLVEQFYTEEKVIRLTGAKDEIEWVTVNQMDVDADGTVRILNDITASIADFVMSEQDYAGTLRQVMFDSINAIAQRLPPEIALRIMTIAMEFSDLPNKDEIVQAFRRITGDPDPSRELTPEEQQQVEQQQQQQAEAMELQRQTALAALQEAQAKVRHINAQAAELERRAAAAGGEQAGASEEAIRARAAAADEVDRLQMQVGKLMGELAAVRANRDATVEAARIRADADLRIAQMRQASDDVLSAVQRRVDRALQAVDRALGRSRGNPAPTAPEEPASAPAEPTPV